MPYYGVYHAPYTYAQHPTPLSLCAFSYLPDRPPEWDKYSSFTTFQSSPDILVFRDHIKPHLTAPAKPQLYETDSGPVPCASAPVTEIFQLKVRDSDVQAADRAWGKFVAVVERCVGKGKGEGLVGGAIGGKSLNLEAEVWVGLLGWASLEVSGAFALGCAALGCAALGCFRGEVCGENGAADAHPVD